MTTKTREELRSQIADRAYDKAIEYANGHITDWRDLADEVMQLLDQYTEASRQQWLDTEIAQMLERVYPLDVFPKKRGSDDKQESHMAGIYHGLHILRREVRGMSAREDLAPLPQETEEYYQRKRQSQQENQK